MTLVLARRCLLREEARRVTGEDPHVSHLGRRTMAVRRIPKDPSQPLVGYEVRWRDAVGSSRRKLFKGQQRRAADAFWAQTKAALDGGHYVDTSSKITVTEYAKRWVEIQPYRESSRERRESQIRTHLESSKLGKMRLVRVRHSDVQAFATELDQRRAPETVRGVMRLVAAIFASAARDRLIAYSPAQRIVLSAPEVDPVVPLTVHEVHSLVRAMPERMQAMVVTQTGLGLRVGELLALRVSDVDFLRREVRITEQLHPRTRERMPLKTPASKRTLPLPQMVADAVAAHLAAYPAHDGYLFTNDRGVPYQAHTFQFRLREQARRAGIRPLTSHDLRHTYAAWLLDAGESIAVVAARLGHRNPSITLTTYSHFVPQTEDRTRLAIDLAWNGVTEGSRHQQSGS